MKKKSDKSLLLLRLMWWGEKYRWDLCMSLLVIPVRVVNNFEFTFCSIDCLERKAPQALKQSKTFKILQFFFFSLIFTSTFFLTRMMHTTVNKDGYFQQHLSFEQHSSRAGIVQTVFNRTMWKGKDMFTLMMWSRCVWLQNNSKSLFPAALYQTAYCGCYMFYRSPWAISVTPGS